MSRIDALSLRAKIALGTFSQLFSKLAVAVLSVFTLRYSTQYLGAEVYGQYATVVAYVTIFTLLTDLGLTAITSREIARHPDDTDHIIGNSLAMRLALSVAVSPLIAVGGWWLYMTKPAEIKIGIALMVVTLVFGSVQSVTSALFTAKNRNDLPAVLIVLNKLVYLFAIVAAGALGYGFYGFVYAAIVAALLSALLSVYWAYRRVRLRLLFHMTHWRRMAQLSIPLGIIQIINMLYYKIDSVMLSVMRSPREVGLYAIAYGIIDVVMSVPSFFMTSLMPTLATASNERLRAVVERAFSLLAFVAVLAATGGVLLSKDIVLLISSQAFVHAALPFAILVVSATFSYINAVFGFASVAVNKQGRLLKVSLFTVGLNVVINLFAIPRFGISGAATATLITECVACAGVYFVFWRQTGISVRFGAMWKYIVAAACSLAFAWPISLIHLPLLLHFLLVGMIVAVVYLGTVTFLRGLPVDIERPLGRLVERLKK
ncbi:MAG TPA: flippase [Candidatus Saccharimonadales bacterium]